MLSPASKHQRAAGQIFVGTNAAILFNRSFPGRMHWWPRGYWLLAHALSRCPYSLARSPLREASGKGKLLAALIAENEQPILRRFIAFDDHRGRVASPSQLYSRCTAGLLRQCEHREVVGSRLRSAVGCNKRSALHHAAVHSTPPNAKPEIRAQAERNEWPRIEVMLLLVQCAFGLLHPAALFPSLNWLPNTAHAQ